MKKITQILAAVCLFTSAYSQTSDTAFRKKFKQLAQAQTLLAGRSTSVCLKDSQIVRNWSTSTNSWYNSRRDLFTYDGALNQTTDISFNWNSTWIANVKTTMAYDNANHLLTKLRQFFAGSSLNNSDLQTSIYDSHGNLLSQESQYWNSANSAWATGSKTTNTYDALNNNLTYLYQTFSSSSNAWKDEEKDVYTYSGTNVVSEILQQFSSSANALVNSSKYTYTYDIFNKIVGGIASVWNPTTSTWLNDQKITVTYNGGNKFALIVYQAWNSTTNTWVNDSKISFTYDSNGNELTEKEEIYNSTTNTWSTDFLYTITYDSHNNALTEISQVVNAPSTILENDLRTTHTYDLNNNETTQILEMWDTSTNAWENYYFDNFYYGCKVVGIAELSKSNSNLKLYPNPTSDFISIETEIDYSSCRILNLSGQEVLKIKGNEKMLSVSNFEKGIYFIQLLDKNNSLLQALKFAKE